MSDPLHPEIHDPLTSPVNRDLRDHWLGLCGSRTMPAWREFDPVSVPRLLNRVVVVSVDHEPLRFRYKLIGTWITRLAGRDATGRELDATLYGDRLEAIVWTYRHCVRSGAPLATLGSIHFAEKEWLTAEHIYLPFAGADGRVGTVLGGMDVLDGDARLRDKPREYEAILDWRK